MNPPTEVDRVRKNGKVARLRDDFGFISSDELPGKDIYFKTSWFRGNPPLEEGETVTFELKIYGDRLQASGLARPGQELQEDGHQELRGAPATDRLLQWAYLGYLPNVLDEVKAMMPNERWDFKDTPPNPDRPLPILHSYLLQTFGRLVLEEKVLVNQDGTFAAWNTGLVDRRYETIHALFVPNHDARAPWKLKAFCIAGEGPDGQNLVRQFNPLPQAAHYFDEPADLLYDTRVGKPEMDWRHVVVDRLERYPKEFLEDNWPSGVAVGDTTKMSVEERKAYWAAVAAGLERDNRTYRSIINRLRDAVDLSIKRVSWNFKTAVPQYYPNVRRLQLLLPICLVSDELADMALAVEKTASGSYLGHTVLPLDWAYRNARLVCRPDSDWLDAEEITQSVQEEEDAE